MQAPRHQMCSAGTGRARLMRDGRREDTGEGAVSSARRSQMKQSCACSSSESNGWPQSRQTCECKDMGFPPIDRERGFFVFAFEHKTVANSLRVALRAV